MTAEGPGGWEGEERGVSALGPGGGEEREVAAEGPGGREKERYQIWALGKGEER